MSPEGLSALLTPQGWELLESLPPYDEKRSMALAAALREEGHAPELVSAALTQSRLRARAVAKFGPFAQDMLFTADGLEQATRLDVAARHAARFAAAGVERVADLGCGIGGDSMSLAGLEIPVLAVERDEPTAAVAAMNLRHLPHAEVRHADLNDVDLAAAGIDALWLDPARRDATGRRVFDPFRAEPTWPTVVALAGAYPATGVKLAPGVNHSLIPAGVEAQWISVDGDLLEAVFWFGPLAREVARAATVVRAGKAAEISWPDHNPPRIEAGPLGSHLFEPDDAVLRAGLVGPLATQWGAWGLDPSIGFLTADRPMTGALGTGYRILDSMPFSLKRLRSYLRERGIGRLTIKKRGTAVEPEQLRRQLRATGTGSATLVLTRLHGEQVVLVVQRLEVERDA